MISRRRLIGGLSVLAGSAAMAGVVFATVAIFAGAEPPPPTSPPAADPREVRNLPPPEQRQPSGGPFIDRAQATAEAMRAARTLGPGPFQVVGVRFTTYLESVRTERHGTGQSWHPDSEVYVVHLQGSVTPRRGPSSTSAQTFERSFWIVDASTGELIGWGSAP